MVTALVFVLILGVLVFVHELGHFLTAKKSGVKVDEFGLGFPPRIFGVKKGDTTYSINWIPLGGFVKIKGEDGSEKEDADSFGHQSFLKRSLILSAGVLMNVLLAAVILSVGFMVGLPSVIDTADLRQPWVKDAHLEIADVIASSPAQVAGLLPRDRLLAINGQTVESDQQFIDLVKSSQDSVVLRYQRKGQEVKEATIKPQLIEGVSDKKVLGVNIIQAGFVKHNFFASWYYGFAAAASMLWQIILAFIALFKNLFSGHGAGADLAGPVGVAVLTGQVVSLGFSYILQFAAMLSLNLAVVNFLPFPALDGGRFLFLVIEKIRRKPNNPQVENIIHNIGFSLLMILIVIITYRDIVSHSVFLQTIKGWF